MVDISDQWPVSSGVYRMRKCRKEENIDGEMPVSRLIASLPVGAIVAALSYGTVHSPWLNVRKSHETGSGLLIAAISQCGCNWTIATTFLAHRKWPPLWRELNCGVWNFDPHVYPWPRYLNVRVIRKSIVYHNVIKMYQRQSTLRCIVCYWILLRYVNVCSVRITTLYLSVDENNDLMSSVLC